MIRWFRGWVVVVALLLGILTDMVSYRWMARQQKPCAPADLTALWGKAIVNDGTGTPKLLDAGWAASVERLSAERDKARASAAPATDVDAKFKFIDNIVRERDDMTWRAHAAEADRDKWKALALAQQRCTIGAVHMCTATDVWTPVVTWQADELHRGLAEVPK